MELYGVGLAVLTIRILCNHVAVRLLSVCPAAYFRKLCSLFFLRLFLLSFTSDHFFSILTPDHSCRTRCFYPFLSIVRGLETFHAKEQDSPVARSSQRGFLVYPSHRLALLRSALRVVFLFLRRRVGGAAGGEFDAADAAFVAVDARRTAGRSAAAGSLRYK